MTITRQEQLFNELKTALAVTRQEDLKAWGRRSASLLPVIATRRIRNLGTLLSSLARFTGNELRNAIQAMGEGRLGTHLADRSAAAIDNSLDIGTRIKNTVSGIASALFSDPKSNAPGVLALAMGFLAGSGGLDANGGIPDGDLALGIGWHRSPFTHSIIAGIVVEGAILALVDLTGVIHDKLPPGYDPFWDKLLATKEDFAFRLTQGASAGISYHLGVDATLQPGAYHDLPIEMPMEAHQTILALNALAEGADATHKKQTSPSTGRRFVGAIQSFADDVQKAYRKAEEKRMVQRKQNS
jgi:hypothetical protein